MKTIKFLKANWGDIKSALFFPAVFMLLGSFLSALPGSLWFLPNVAYLLAVASLCVSLPWLFINITAPNSVGKFITDKWQHAWDVVIDRDGKGANEEEVTHARWQFEKVLKLYLALFFGFVAISCAIFLGTPVG